MLGLESLTTSWSETQNLLPQAIIFRLMSDFLITLWILCGISGIACFTHVISHHTLYGHHTAQPYLAFAHKGNQVTFPLEIIDLCTFQRLET